MNIGPVKIGLVAALEREITSIVRGWSTTTVRVDDSEHLIHFNDRVALICAGTGVERAYIATKVLVEKCCPRVVISIGFAGSCVSRLNPGSVVVPGTVLDAATGRAYRSNVGCGQLVTLDRIAGSSLKHSVSERFGALAVDMEAAGVAAVAAECDREFAAIKVISDGVEEDLSFLSEYVKPEGFETGRFIRYIALRPHLWPKVATLGRHSKLAGVALEREIRECTGDWESFSEKHSDRRTGAMKESC